MNGRRPGARRAKPRTAASRPVAAGLALLGVLTALAACTGTEPGTVPAPRAVVPGTVGRTCHFVHPPGSSPPFTQLARLGTRGNIALWSRGLGPADSVELSVRYADDGRLLWVQAIRSNVTPERLEPLQGLLLEAMTDSIRPDWGVRLWVVDGEVTEVAPSVICPPRPRRGSAIVPRVVDERTLQGLIRLSGRRFPVEVGIDERGNVISVRLVRPTGSYAADQYILEYVWRTSFEPKLHDGIGVSSVLETEIRFPRWR